MLAENVKIAIQRAYKLGYEDKGVRDYDFNQHEHPIIDNNVVANQIQQLQQQVEYWKRSFNKQIASQRSADTGLLEAAIARRTFKPKGNS